MAKLIANVCIDGQWYGPAHGNAESVPAEVADRIGPHAWDQTAKGKATTPAEPPDSPPAPPSVERGLAAALAALPDKKKALIAFRDAHGLDGDARMTVANLRAALEESIGS